MVSANFLGNYEPQGAIIIQAEKTGSAIAKGDVCDLSSNKWRKAPAGTGPGPYAVCTKAAAASDTTVQLLLAGICYVTAAMAISPNQTIIVSAGTAGAVDTTATPTLTTLVGIYLGHENEGDGSTVPTAAANTDVIRIKLGGGLT